MERETLSIRKTQLSILDSVIQFANAFCVSFDGSVAMTLGETRTWNVSAKNMSIVKVVLVYSTS